MKTWNWGKNNQNNIFPENIMQKSNKKVWWLCNKCGYEWLTSPNNRSRGTNCPLCANKVIVSGINDLATLYPDIAKRWHPTLNNTTPDKVAPKSNKKAFWVCETHEDHVFETKIYHMVDSKIKCPICANQKIVVGYNDLATTHPEIIKEWDYDKNLPLTPQSVTYGNTTKVWWKCENGHSWKASINSRVGRSKTGCPICKKELFISFPEKSISYYLRKHFDIEDNKKFEWLGQSELDIFIPELNLAIEYDGQAWHKNINRDLRKDLICEKHNIKLIRVREEKCPYYESSSIKFITKKLDIKCLSEVIVNIVNYINSNYSQNIREIIDIEKDYYEILSQISVTIKEKSVFNSPLIREWNYEKNGNVSPKTISINSHKKVWWKCKERHEWQASVYTRSGNMNSGCPICSGKKVLSGWNDLETLNPNVAKEWDYAKNYPILPSQVRPKSNKKYWWVCSVCGYSWETAISHRTEGKGCPKCARNKTISSHYKKVLCIETNETFDSIREASQIMGINRSAISNCCRKKCKTAGKFHWVFMEDK